MRRVHAVFEGRVQGVGFRATTRSIALGLKVTGWVRNDPSGTVTMEAQGESTQIDALLEAIDQRLGRGIQASKVGETTVVADELEFRITS